MDKFSTRDELERVIRTVPNVVHVGEVKADPKNLIGMTKAMSKGHHISMEMHREISKKVRDEMLQEAFRHKDKETINLIENVKKLDDELEEYRYIK